MNIKKIIILIGFVVFSLVAGNAFACSGTCYSAPQSDFSGIHAKQANTTDTSYTQGQIDAMPLYTYQNNTSYPQNNQNYVHSGSGYQYAYAPSNGNVYVPSTYGENYLPSNPQAITYTSAPAPTYVMTQPTYIPASPIIFGGNGTYTEQLTGRTITTGTSGNNTPSAENEEESGGILDGLFGGNRKKLFSGDKNDSIEIDQDLSAVVNSKGLAIGSNNDSCARNEIDYIILFKNISKQTVTNSAIRVSFPDGITPKDSFGGSYSKRDNTLTFYIGTLTPNQEGQIRVTGEITGNVTGVTRSEFVFTYPNQVQDMIVSYAFDKSTCASGGLSANALGSGFFSGTLIGWLFLAVLVSALIYVIRFFIKRPHQNNHSHGH